MKFVFKFFLPDRSFEIETTKYEAYRHALWFYISLLLTSYVSQDIHSWTGAEGAMVDASQVGAYLAETLLQKWS